MPSTLSSGSVARDPRERHSQRRRIVHEIKHIIKPATGIGRRPTVKLGLHLRYPLPRPLQALGRSTTIRRCVFRHCSHHLPPIAVALPHAAGFPGPGVLRRLRPVPNRSADDEPSPPLRTGRTTAGKIRDGSRVHCDSLDRGGARLCPSGLAAPTPQTFSAASRSPASRLPKVPHHQHGWLGTHRSQPTSTRFRADRALRGFTPSVPRVLLSIPLTGPTPSGSAGTPRLCQSCSRPPRHLPDQPALSSYRIAATTRRRRSPTSTQTTAPHGARNPRSTPSRSPSKAVSSQHHQLADN